MRLIDADALKRYISLGYMRPPTEKCFSELDVIKMIDAQEAIEERKTGKWIPYLSNGLTVMCSECGSRFDRPWHLCPNCGSYNGGAEHDEG